MKIEIRSELSSDIECIDKITIDAFRDAVHSDQTEQFIVKELRRAGVLTISLVAAINDTVIGHVAISPVVISSGASGWYGLGPISVSPSFQRQGVGSLLMRAAIEKLQSLGASGCVLLGDPGYYSRFDFKPEDGLVFPGVPVEYFQALSFGGSIPKGIVTYHSAFGAKG